MASSFLKRVNTALFSWLVCSAALLSPLFLSVPTCCCTADMGEQGLESPSFSMFSFSWSRSSLWTTLLQSSPFRFSLGLLLLSVPLCCFTLSAGEQGLESPFSFTRFCFSLLDTLLELSVLCSSLLFVKDSVLFMLVHWPREPEVMGEWGGSFPSHREILSLILPPLDLESLLPTNKLFSLPWGSKFDLLWAMMSDSSLWLLRLSNGVKGSFGAPSLLCTVPLFSTEAIWEPLSSPRRPFFSLNTERKIRINGWTVS